MVSQETKSNNALNTIQEPQFRASRCVIQEMKKTLKRKTKTRNIIQHHEDESIK